MSRYTGPKAKLCRREGMNLFGSEKYTKILGKKPYAPGQHAKNKTGKPSEYSTQLREKQKLARMFGVNMRQLTRYYQEASRRTGSTSDNLLSLLETRLDNAIYRAGLAMTRFQSRQFASHGIFMVNGRRATVPSMAVSPGDVIEARPRAKNSKMFENILRDNAKYKAPSWLNSDMKNLKIEVKEVPKYEHFEKEIDAQKIVEFYSK